MMADSDAIKRLLERLQTGWAPQADEIQPAVPQVDALNWQWNFEDAGTIVPLGITYQTIDRQATPGFCSCDDDGRRPKCH
jgi:hypothetical protein